MRSSATRILLIGYGNPGRLDDGLGPALAACIEGLSIPGVAVESDYQLTVEHAHDITDYDVVIFADADISGNEPFYFRRLIPSASSGLGSHEVTPGEVISLAQTLFGAATQAYILGIRGYDFNEFGEKLSDLAVKNLAAAVDFVSTVIRERNFEEAAECFTCMKQPVADIYTDNIILN